MVLLCRQLLRLYCLLQQVLAVLTEDQNVDNMYIHSIKVYLVTHPPTHPPTPTPTHTLQP